MPIRPENRHHYRTAEWLGAKAAVIERAAGRCERCGVPNGRLIVRGLRGGWYDYEELCGMNSDVGISLVGDNPEVRIVLTVAHLDQNPENNALDNLAHLCQQCHNRHDARARAAGIKRRRRDKLNTTELNLR